MLTEAAWEWPGRTVFWTGATALRALNSGRNFALRRAGRSDLKSEPQRKRWVSRQTMAQTRTDTRSWPAAERVKEGKAVRPGHPFLPWRSERPLNPDPPSPPPLLAVGLPARCCLS